MHGRTHGVTMAQADAQAKALWGHRAFAIQLPDGRCGIAFMLGLAEGNWGWAQLDAETASNDVFFIPTRGQGGSSDRINTDHVRSAPVVARKAS